PIPRFPELDSITTLPALTAPVRIASWRICNAGLSLALPPGLKPSSLAKTWNGQSGNTRVKRTSGVWPIVDKMLSLMIDLDRSLSNLTTRAEQCQRRGEGSHSQAQDHCRVPNSTSWRSGPKKKLGPRNRGR